jgi:serine/threonine protein kinase
MILTEPFSQGSLRQLLKKKPKPDWQLKLSLARDIALALAFLHKKRMIHGYARSPITTMPQSFLLMLIYMY